MTCNVKKHHRKRHPMSEGERVMWEIRFEMIGQKRFRGLTGYAGVLAFRFARKRRERETRCGTRGGIRIKGVAKSEGKGVRGLWEAVS